MDIATACTTLADEKKAALDVCNQIKNKISAPSFLFVLSTVTYKNKIILAELKKTFNDAKIIGGTSCKGIITEKGYSSENNHGLGLFAIKDDNASYGVAALSLTSNPLVDGENAVRLALENAGRQGELPSLILLTSAPGQEESILNGIMNVVGNQVPIFGGSSADNDISGMWEQFSSDNIFQNGVAIAVIFAEHSIGYAFHNGYIPTEYGGTVTNAQGRIVNTIDGKPAAEVYNQWTQGLLNDVIKSNANILGLSTYYPIGREVGKIATIPYYSLSHPNAVYENGSLSFFSTLQINDKITLMTGTKNGLKTRIKRVLHLAKENYSLLSHNKPKGAFIVYCAGCFLAIQNEIQDVLDAIHTELPTEPFLGMFSFGEQGCMFGGENRHGNLMISAIIFG